MSNSGATLPGLADARNLIRNARHALVLTGAGVSAESGMPVFRGSSGLWRSFRAEELATPEAFARDPRLVWEWYAWRRDIAAACQPNPAHTALARWMCRTPGAVLVTQNVDGLHERAAREIAEKTGDSPTPPLQLHGSIFRARCTRCGGTMDYRQPVDSSTVDALPRCDGCAGLLRPDVVWFGERLPAREMALALEAARRADVCLVIGTRGAVFPAAGLVYEARERGAAVIVVDPAETELDRVADIRLRSAAAETVPALLDADPDGLGSH